MCGFDKPWFGASYPDSYCVDGYLHDADGDGYIPSDKSEPCPRCNTRQFLEGRKDEADGTVSQSWGTGGGMVTITGEEIWERSKRWARQENPEQAEALIAELDQPRGLSAAEEARRERI
jgi:hypothetical protein